MDRLSAARDRVSQVKAELYSPAAEFPCINCRYFEITCTHPAASLVKVSPVSGRVTTTHLAADKVRAEDGACGPEGALFDPRSPLGYAVVSVITSKWFGWAAFLGGALLLDKLLV